MTHIGTEATESQVKQIAKEAVEYQLSDLIQPSDIQDGATKWTDIERHTVEQECHDSAEIMLKEQRGPFYGMVRDYAIILWRDNMPRVNRDHLTTDNDRDILVDMGYWPYDMSYFEVYQVLDEYINDTYVSNIRGWAWNEACETVEIGIVLGMLPNCYQGDN